MSGILKFLISNKYILIAINILLYPSINHAQQLQPEQTSTTEKVLVIARNYGDSIAFRFGPSNVKVWLLANKFGYIVERKTILRDKKILFDNKEVIRLTAQPLKPATLEEMGQMNKIDDKVGIIAQAIYGKLFTVVGKNSASPASMLDQAKELDNRFSFAMFAADQSLVAAKAHGLYFIDKNIKQNETYFYKIYINLPDSSEKVDTALAYIKPWEKEILPQPIDLKAEFADRKVILSWDRPILSRFYSHYTVEQSVDGGKTFSPVNRLPFINPVKGDINEIDNYIFIDTLPANAFIFKYRVKGHTFFGETGPPSDTVEGAGVPDISDFAPEITNYRVLNSNMVILQWKLDPYFRNEVTGYEIIRARKPDGTYKVLNNKPVSLSDSTFLDSSAMAVNYYQVQAIDIQGRKHASLAVMVQLEDTLAPLAPVNLKGAVDSAGIVTITWNANGEDDLNGYNLFRANNPNAEFIKINTSGIFDNSYTDTISINTLTPNVYYKVSAIDKHYNQSAFSQVLLVKRPDIIPPAPPSIEKIASTDSGIFIIWVKSPSIDVKSYILKKTSGTDSTVIDISAITTTYKDTNTTSGTMYQYSLWATDSAGNKSQAVSFSAKAIAMSKTEEVVTDLKATKDYEQGTITVQWRYPGKNARKFMVYRKVNDGMLQKYRLVESNVFFITDNNVGKEKTYTYVLQILQVNKVYSILSNPLIVKY